jgi:putative DNA methylase
MSQKTFIETQFPIARLSAESYKERKAGASQTLTGLGKWWGRKPLILVRASILGMLMPASEDAVRDREIFLKILTMDDEGAWNRCKPADQRKLGQTKFNLLPYADRIAMCERPENVSGPSRSAWMDINNHLGTEAYSLPELIDQLGKRTYGHTPKVGDCFCGGGSIPFEAARIGCEAFGSDLNPVAGLLTWASLNLLGSGPEVQKEVRKTQEQVFAAVDKQITEWGIEHNAAGERAEAFLYCVEVKPDGCDYYIPLAPSWVVSEKYRIVTTWERTPGSDRLSPKVVEVSPAELAAYKAGKGRTVENNRVKDPFDSERSWPMISISGHGRLRKWTNEDVVPRPTDVFQERLYCIRWINKDGERRYAEPDAQDIAREYRVLELLMERFVDWQREGFIPSKAIPVDGDKTEEPIRTRGWSHWHHLFTPRQLLNHGLLNKSCNINPVQYIRVSMMLSSAMIANFDSKLCIWDKSLAKSGGIGAFVQTFSNQALNTLYNYGSRGLHGLSDFVAPDLRGVSFDVNVNRIVITRDARDVSFDCDVWLTDPPYADAVNYHELGDFFLAWYDKQLTKVFPDWVPDARAELAVKGTDEGFKRSMVEVYTNLRDHMPDNGVQMVMFTHQDPGVWADLGMILWASGLQATAAWTISTETAAVGLKQGNYVQGTVCLLLRKRLDDRKGYLDEVYPMVEDAVRAQIDSMRSLDDAGEPNFNDSDYQLAAYAAALQVLTQFSKLEDTDVNNEVFREYKRGEKSQFEEVIERAIHIAGEILIPRGLETSWRNLTLAERFYLRALDIESRGEHRQGMYQELARGFGLKDIKPLLLSDKANGARMRTPIDFATLTLASMEEQRAITKGKTGPHEFASTDLRHLLFAVREVSENNSDTELGRNYLKDYLGSLYWTRRSKLIELLEWLACLSAFDGMETWAKDSESARLLAGRLRNDTA